ncbi:FMN-dependent NADH-azoreductase [Actibacterium lipolyticum]|nr:NAD(P)H-dependent oxidoreductase [Actibacterium lipolyticum]
MSQSILRIDSSIKGGESVSRKLTDEIIERLTKADASATVVARDLSEITPPMINGAWLGSVFTPEADRSTEQSATAELSDTLIAEIKAADVLVIALPVYNFAVPAQLKAWIDQICRAGVTFNYSEDGPVGTMTGKRAIVAYASNGTRFGSEIDFASPYIKHMLGFIGITDVQFVASDHMAIDAEASMKAANDAIEGLKLTA